LNQNNLPFILAQRQVIKDALQPEIYHRCNLFKTIEGVNYINDCQSNCPNMLWYALEITPKPLILIAGGQYSSTIKLNFLEPYLKPVKTIISLETKQQLLKTVYGGKIYYAKSMFEAISYAYHLANKGDNVLCSPGASSFNLFDGWEDRYHQFNTHINSI